jgi:RHS repeat-associated protein
MPGRNFNTTTYRYGFNGKEKDDELKGSGNSYDFGARIYDPRVGRWLAVDPLSGKYPNLSPYNFVANMPICAIDPDGKLIIFVNGYRPEKTQGEIMSFGDRKVFKDDKYKYWGGMDDKFKQRIGDNNAIYADASEPAFSSADARYEIGKEQGMDILDKIKNGEIVLAKDDAGKVIETIKIVAHSQGAAAAAGQAEVLTNAGYNVEVIYNIAPKQPGDIKTPEGVGRIVQYGSDKDWIAPQSNMPGVDESVKMPNNGNNGHIGGHLLKNMGWIFDIIKGKAGEVKKGSDVDKRDQKAQETFDKNFNVTK